METSRHRSTVTDALKQHEESDCIVFRQRKKEEEKRKKEKTFMEQNIQDREHITVSLSEMGARNVS